jgi:hypothetical protein
MMITIEELSFLVRSMLPCKIRWTCKLWLLYAFATLRFAFLHQKRLSDEENLNGPMITKMKDRRYVETTMAMAAMFEKLPCRRDFSSEVTTISPRGMTWHGPATVMDGSVSHPNLNSTVTPHQHALQI